MNVGILGLGLIGGSLARAYSKAGHNVFAQDTDGQMLEFAQLSGSIQGPLTEENLPSCDLVFLAIYPAGCAAWLEENAPRISRDALVLDCCGIKREVCERCFPLAQRLSLIHISETTDISGSRMPSSA